MREDRDESTVRNNEGSTVILEVAYDEPVVEGEGDNRHQPVMEGDLHSVGVGIDYKSKLVVIHDDKDAHTKLFLSS